MLAIGGVAQLAGFLAHLGGTLAHLDRAALHFVGAAGHVRFNLTADDGSRLRAIAFRAATTPLGQALLAAGNDAPVHVAGSLSLDHYKGREQVQLRVTDAAIPPPL